MEEELNENDLEERLYAMLHHVDETQNNLNTSNQNEEASRILENAPRSTVRRYWRTSADTCTPKVNTPHQKINTPQQKINILTPLEINKIETNTKPKEEKCVSSVEPVVDLSILQSPVPQNIKKTIQILDHDVTNQVVLESSDEDEVIEVALPPKPTITIESSDEDELQLVKPDSPSKNITNKPNAPNKSQAMEREVSASPVPSVVSSVSDEFIRGDCIAFNISSRHPDNHSFDFSLHGPDLVGQSTPNKKKKKKKNKDPALSISETPVKSLVNNADDCFATPKNKAKNKGQKNKSYSVTEKSLPNVDVYDSDSNQSLVDTNKQSSYIVSDKSFPSVDVYESDSSLSGTTKNNTKSKTKSNIESSDSNISFDDLQETPRTKKNDCSYQSDKTINTVSFVDLTVNDSSITVVDTDISENIVIGNVSGFTEFEDYGNDTMSGSSPSKFGSTKVPAILNEDLDFDNLKGKNTVCKRRRYSLTTLRAEMEKFYNESWGGEDFNHREIQKNMSRDKSLWMIDPKDRMPSLAKRKVTCNYCNRAGHRDDTCRLKPAVCYMCGLTGHFETRCPKKICVNCGSPNHMYSNMCRNCCNWGSVICVECGQSGHPSSHCPDLWRRYHNSIDINMALERVNQPKKHYQQYCSGCTRRGHLVHTCRITLPFSGLPINSPYVCMYRPLYPPSQDSRYKKNTQDSIMAASTPRNERLKRQSKSPTAHETHVNKKRNMSTSEDSEARRNTKSPVNSKERKTSQTRENGADDAKKSLPNKNYSDSLKTNSAEKAPNLIPLSSTNHDNKGQIIQDNEVSDTSDAVTSARIYVTNDLIDLMKTAEGEQWLKETTAKHNVVVETADINSFLSIKGKVADQESFQGDLRDWTKSKQSNENMPSQVVPEDNSDNALINIPKNRNRLIRQLSKALESLKDDLGDPKALYKEFTYLQNKHQQLLKQKVVNPKKLTNNKSHINEMLRKLNMVLIGQAGLANGPDHVSELYMFHEKLQNCRQKILSPELRKAIGEHYHYIFAPTPRDDYTELLRMYDSTKQPFVGQKKQKSCNSTPRMNMLKKFKGIPPEPIHNIHAEGEEKARDNGQIARNLALYHKRVMKTRPTDSILKKTRWELARKLHSMLCSLFRNQITSSKTLKKMRKAQTQAQLFLANV